MVDGNAVFQSAATLLALALLLPAHFAGSVRFGETRPAFKAFGAGLCLLLAMLVSFVSPLAGALLIVAGVLFIAYIFVSDFEADPREVEAGKEVVEEHLSSGVESIADKTARIAEDFGHYDRGF